KGGNRKADEAMAEQFDFQGFFSRIFTDPVLAHTCFKSDRLMAETCVTNGSVADYLGIPELVRCMTPSEFETASKIYNAKQYFQHCGSAEQGEWRMHLMDPLVMDFVEKADAAVAGNNVAADLRFSHDVGMMPFFSLIGLAGYDARLRFEEVCDHWNATYMMPMATNLQLVFFRNRKGDVLVKVMFNEGESSIPALGPGPYYSWPVLREYLLSTVSGKDS
ncbi:MAG: histidine-type phosphatase, partial [Bacteroidales bacterium]|nr:histidine-type phosphatase [Bacteroidales bacterium]